MRSTRNLNRSSLWFWRLLSKLADLSKPWGRFFQVLCVSQKVRTLKIKFRWPLYADLMDNIFRILICTFLFNLFIKTKLGTVKCVWDRSIFSIFWHHIVSVFMIICTDLHRYDHKIVFVVVSEQFCDHTCANLCKSS